MSAPVAGWKVEIEARLAVVPPSELVPKLNDVDRADGGGGGGTLKPPLTVKAGGGGRPVVIGLVGPASIVGCVVVVVGLAPPAREANGSRASLRYLKINCRYSIRSLSICSSRSATFPASPMKASC